MTLTILLTILVFLIGLYFYTIYADLKYTHPKNSITKHNKGYINQGFKPRCPNLLIQKNSKFYLYNSKLAEVPGVNPIQFDNLEEYTEFLDWQRSQGIRCPVLYLQSTYDAQGKQVYKVRPSVSEPQAGLPLSTSQPLSTTQPLSTVKYNQSYKEKPSVSEPREFLPPSANPPVGIASQEPPIMESSLGDPNALAYPNPTLLVDATRNDPPYNTNSYPAYDQSSYYIGTTTPLDMMDVAQEKAPISPNPMDSNWGGAEYTQSLVDRGYYKDNEVNIIS
jgi:hypothetical protein